ncbi:MAG: hypothetical protein HKN87_07135 [Saprospiraceae bacterium]|nr:hypothetical protein [Saprospiraceae bacterium]
MRSDQDIEKYLMGELGPAEIEAFEKAMALDPALRAAVHKARTLMCRNKKDTLQHELSSTAQEEDENSGAIVKQMGPARKKQKPQSWTIAVSILVLVAVLYFIIRPNPNQPYYQVYYVVDPGLPTPMSTTDEFSFYGAMVDFKNEEYAIAIEKWEQLLSQKPQNDSLIYYVGSAELAQGNNIKASYHFSKLIDGIDGPFVNESRWYWSLCQLALQNRKIVMKKWILWDFPSAISDKFPAKELWQEMITQ